MVVLLGPRIRMRELVGPDNHKTVHDAVDAIERKNGKGDVVSP